MPTNKDFKRLVRGRMQKTGESYAAARAQLLRSAYVSRKSVVTPATAVDAPPPKPTPSQYAAIAGMSDAAVKKATGCTWEAWVKALDRDTAFEWSHAKIA